MIATHYSVTVTYYNLQQAITVMDHKVCDTMKRLNSMKHQSAQKQKRLEKLQTEYQQMVDDSSEAVATDKGESKDAQVRDQLYMYRQISSKSELLSVLMKSYDVIYFV